MLKKFLKFFQKTKKDKDTTPPVAQPSPKKDESHHLRPPIDDSELLAGFAEVNKKMREILEDADTSPPSKGLLELLRAISSDESDKASQFLGAPSKLPPSNKFTPGTVVVLNEPGVDNLLWKISGKAKFSDHGMLLKSPNYGCVISMLPATQWSNVSHVGGVVGSSPLDPADCLVAVGSLDDGDSSIPIKVLAKYSGFLREASKEIAENFVGLHAIPQYPEAKLLGIGDTVTMDPDLLDHPYSCLTDPRNPNYGIVVDVFPTQYLSPAANSWDGPVCPFDCVLSLNKNGKTDKLYFYHYSGWLVHAPQ